MIGGGPATNRGVVVAVLMMIMMKTQNVVVILARRRSRAAFAEMIRAVRKRALSTRRERPKNRRVLIVLSSSSASFHLHEHHRHRRWIGRRCGVVLVAEHRGGLVGHSLELDRLIHLLGEALGEGGERGRGCLLRGELDGITAFERLAAVIAVMTTSGGGGR